MTLLEGLLARYRRVGSPSRVDALVQGELLLVSEALLALRPVAALCSVALLVKQEALLLPEGFTTLGAHQGFVTWALPLVWRSRATATQAPFARDRLVSWILRMPPLVHQCAVPTPDGGALVGTVEDSSVCALQP